MNRNQTERIFAGSSGGAALALAGHADRPVLRIEPSRGWAPLKLGELWAHRELLFFFTWRDIKVRYKQTALGAAWAIIQPFFTMLVFSLFFGRLAKMPSDGIPYPVFSYAALVPWMFFAHGLNQSSNSLVENSNLIKKVYFPRLAIPISTALSGLVDFVLAFLMLIAMMAFYGLRPTMNVIWLPLLLLLALVTSLGVGLWISALNVQFRDFRYIVPFLAQFWLFATPVAYPSSLLSEPWRTIYALNPMVGVVTGFRWALLGSNSEAGTTIIASAVAALAILVGGAYYFRRMEKTSPMWFESKSGCFIIAEVAQNHDGSLGAAHAYIDAIARTGADAVKFQTHIADAESTPGEPWRIRFSRQDENRYEYWKRMEFTSEQWAGLAAHAAEVGLVFLSSPFSLAAFELLERIGVPAWKVGAGEITNLPMIERMARTRKPVLLSSGLASWDDLDAAVMAVNGVAGGRFGIFQCTSAYPCPPEELGLNVIGEIRRRYGCPAGLSDHSGTIYAGLAAATLGAEMLEAHTVFSRECFGPDVPASITTAELTVLAEGVRFIRAATANPVDKSRLGGELRQLRAIFAKSVFAAKDLPAGICLSEDDLALKKPGTGIPAARLSTVLHRRLKRALPANTAISEDDLEQKAT